VSSDPWLHILQQIQPLYFEWKKELENGPNIIADISRKGRSWCVTLQEKNHSSEWTPVWIDPGKIDERVDWVTEQLTTWPSVRRMAHDMWYFKRRKDAEKFQMLYNLKWASE
jgi:hypothetical protein